jgi:hypothetical protein
MKVGPLQETCSFGKGKKSVQVGFDIVLLVAHWRRRIAAVFCHVLFLINASKHVSRRNF